MAELMPSDSSICEATLAIIDTFPCPARSISLLNMPPMPRAAPFATDVADAAVLLRSDARGREPAPTPGRSVSSSDSCSAWLAAVSPACPAATAAGPSGSSSSSRSGSDTIARSCAESISDACAVRVSAPAMTASCSAGARAASASASDASTPRALLSPSELYIAAAPTSSAASSAETAAILAPRLQ